MMPEPLTKLERRILDYLVDYLRRNTYQPSIREIGRRFDIKSTKTVSEYLQSLADKGWIERDPSRSRGVKLLGVDLSSGTVTVPCYRGRMERDSAVDEFELDRKLAGASGSFCVSMAGDSMEGAGFRDGDLLLAEPIAAEDVENGDTIVAELSGVPTVKRYFRRGDEVVLEPANANYPPTLVRVPSELNILGRVIGVIRRLRSPVGAAAGVGGTETI
jgi:repressor LexA